MVYAPREQLYNLFIVYFQILQMTILMMSNLSIQWQKRFHQILYL